MERFLLTYGTRRVGALIPIPKEMLHETIPGAIYEVEIQTEGIPDPNLALNHILKELPRYIPEIKIYWIGITGKTIRIQLSASPVLWSVLILILPLILSAIGIAAILIGVFLLAGGPGLWILLLLAAGLFLTLIAPKIPDIIKAMRIYG